MSTPSVYYANGVGGCIHISDCMISLVTNPTLDDGFAGDQPVGRRGRGEPTLRKPAHRLPVGAGVLVPEVSEILKYFVVGDHKRRDRCGGQGTPFPVVTRDLCFADHNIGVKMSSAKRQPSM